MLTINDKILDKMSVGNTKVDKFLYLQKVTNNAKDNTDNLIVLDLLNEDKIKEYDKHAIMQSLKEVIYFLKSKNIIHDEDRKFLNDYIKDLIRNPYINDIYDHLKSNM